VIERFHLELPLPLLFQSPTVAEMAKIIAANRDSQLHEDKLAMILTELESLTEEQAQKLTK
jgi:hypothetical protein